MVIIAFRNLSVLNKGRPVHLNYLRFIWERTILYVTLFLLTRRGRNNDACNCVACGTARL